MPLEMNTQTPAKSAEIPASVQELKQQCETLHEQLAKLNDMLAPYCEPLREPEIDGAMPLQRVGVTECGRALCALRDSVDNAIDTIKDLLSRCQL